MNNLQEFIKELGFKEPLELTKEQEQIIRNDFKKYNIKSNPFDILVYFTSELFRASLFASSRLRTNMDRFGLTRENIERFLDKIVYFHNLLYDIDEETVKFLRYYSKYESVLEILNEKILPIQRAGCTEYTETYPLYDLQYAWMFGDMDSYMRLIELSYNIAISRKDSMLYQIKVLYRSGNFDNILDYVFDETTVYSDDPKEIAEFVTADNITLKDAEILKSLLDRVPDKYFLN